MEERITDTEDAEVLEDRRKEWRKNVEAWRNELTFYEYSCACNKNVTK